MRNVMGTPHKRPTVLVVNDDPAILILLRGILESQDYRVLLSWDLDVALRCVGQKHMPVDLALIDTELDDIGGIALAGRLLSLRPSLRVLFMHGCIDNNVIRVQVFKGGLGFEEEE